MEKQITIKTKDNYLIYGTLNWQGKKPKSLIVFVHGFGGSQYDSKFSHAARVFSRKGFATFRFDFCGMGKDARNLKDIDLKREVEDYTRVVGSLKKTFPRIFVVGHSLGGVVILKAQLISLRGIVLWDPGHNIYQFHTQELKRFQYVPSLRSYVNMKGSGFLLGKQMNDDFLNFREYTPLVEAIHAPMKIICAGGGRLSQFFIHGGKEYFTHANEPKEFAIIKNASHNFVEEGAEEALFKETLKFVKKYS